MKDDSLKNSMELAFAETLAGEIDIIDQELTDATIKLLFSKNELISTLPIIKTIVGVTKTGLSIKDLLFTKKLLRLLQISSEVPLSERKEFIEKIETDKKYRTKVGETYISCIEKARDTESAEQIAYLSNACIKGKMDYDDFLRCVNIILTISSGGLRDFILLDKNSMSEASMDELIYSGLYRIIVTPIDISVKDDDEIKQEEKKKKMERPFTIPFEDIIANFNQHQTGVFDFAPRLLGFEQNSQGKYHSTVEGGKVDFHISKIGNIIKEVLADYYNS